jgi:hypothetical protein
MVAAELAIGTLLGVQIVLRTECYLHQIETTIYWILRITHKLHFSFRGWPPYMTMNMRNNHPLLFIIPLALSF